MERATRSMETTTRSMERTTRSIETTIRSTEHAWRSTETMIRSTERVQLDMKRKQLGAAYLVNFQVKIRAVLVHKVAKSARGNRTCLQISGSDSLASLPETARRQASWGKKPHELECHEALQLNATKH